MSTERVTRSVRELAKTAEALGRQSEELASFARRLVETFNQGGRLLLIAGGPLSGVADLAASRFLHRLSMERPLLPALSLCHDTTLAASLARDGQASQYFVRQLRTVTSGGDILLALSDGHRDEGLRDALATAHRLDCLTASLSPRSEEDYEEKPDFIFHLEAETPSRIAEGALFFSHLLCELVEAELFGI
jgi:D-sedoheptulose 7-phosphate isomerase